MVYFSTFHKFKCLRPHQRKLVFVGPMCSYFNKSVIIILFYISRVRKSFCSVSRSNLFFSLYSCSHLHLEIIENLLIHCSRRIKRWLSCTTYASNLKLDEVEKLQKTTTCSTTSTAISMTFDVLWLSTNSNPSRDLEIKMRMNAWMWKYTSSVDRKKTFGHWSY